MGKDINRIKVVLVEKKKTNKWLSEQLGCAYDHSVEMVYKCLSAPMETFLKIAKILDVELDELLNKSHLTSLDNE